MLVSSRLAAVLVSLSLVPAFAAVQAFTGSDSAAAEGRKSESVLRPADGVHRARIKITEHGIPHVVAKDYESLGFGHGYATATTSICTLADTLLTARGERSRWFGPHKRYSDQVTLFASNLQADTLFTDIRDRRVVEKLLADPKRGPGKRPGRSCAGTPQASTTI